MPREGLTELTSQEEDLIRWCYVIAGGSRARLARDFECSLSDIEQIVSTGLGEILNPGSKHEPRTAPIRFARLPMAEALQVWDAATATEKAELTQEFIKKKNAYMRKAYNADPEARAKDKIYRRLVAMFG